MAPGQGYSSQLIFTAPSAGTYYLASSALGNDTGTYKVSASVLSTTLVDDYAASAATTGSVAVGGSISGSIETTGDVDWIKVNLIAGTTYRFDLEGSDTGQGTLQSPRLQLLNSAGIQLLHDLDSGGDGGPGEGYSSQLTFTAPSAGTYYLASSALGNDTGTYKVSASVLSTTLVDDYAASAATTGSVAVGGSISGSIETTGDVDWIKVNLIAGTTYRFDLEGSDTGQGTLQSPRLQLLNSAGIQLLNDLDSGGYGGPGEGYSSQLIFTAPSAGTYYLASSALGQ